MYEKWGYTGALWCSVYSLGMVPIVDTTQPNNPDFSIWYGQLLCPWDFDGRPDTDEDYTPLCGLSDDELSADESQGQLVCPEDQRNNPTVCAPHQHPQYAIYPASDFAQIDPTRKTMSCALCGRLKRTFPAGPPAKPGRRLGGRGTHWGEWLGRKDARISVLRATHDAPKAPATGSS